MLAALAAIATGLAALTGWTLAARRARGRERAQERLWDERFVEQLKELDQAVRRSSQLSGELTLLQSRLGTAEAGLASARAALDARTAELEADRAELARSAARIVDGKAALAAAEARGAEAAALRQRTAELERASAALQTRCRELEERARAEAQARTALESERMGLVLRVETLQTELAHAAELGRRELDTHRRALSAANALVEQSRREAAAMAGRVGALGAELDRLSRDRDQIVASATRAAAEASEFQARCRELELRLQALAVEKDAAIGGLEARVERLDPLLRQLEDREALLQAALFERDEARRLVVQAERERAASQEACERAESAVVRIAEERERLARELEESERKVAELARDRDACRAAIRRLEIEVATVRGELRDREQRFRALAAENDALVADLRLRVRDLEADLESAGLIEPDRQAAPAGNGAASVDADDLTEIHGIGPVFARRLARYGVTRIAQIAAWTEEDIERHGRLLGGLPDRIRRDGWVEGARRALDRRQGAADS